MNNQEAIRELQDRVIKIEEHLVRLDESLTKEVLQLHQVIGAISNGFTKEEMNLLRRALIMLRLDPDPLGVKPQ